MRGVSVWLLTIFCAAAGMGQGMIDVIVERQPDRGYRLLASHPTGERITGSVAGNSVDETGLVAMEDLEEGGRVSLIAWKQGRPWLRTSFELSDQIPQRLLDHVALQGNTLVVRHHRIAPISHTNMEDHQGALVYQLLQLSDGQDMTYARAPVSGVYRTSYSGMAFSVEVELAQERPDMLVKTHITRAVDSSCSARLRVDLPRLPILEYQLVDGHGVQHDPDYLCPGEYWLELFDEDGFLGQQHVTVPHFPDTNTHRGQLEQFRGTTPVYHSDRRQAHSHRALNQHDAAGMRTAQKAIGYYYSGPHLAEQHRARMRHVQARNSGHQFAGGSDEASTQVYGEDTVVRASKVERYHGDVLQYALPELVEIDSATLTQVTEIGDFRYALEWAVWDFGMPNMFQDTVELWSIDAGSRFQELQAVFTARDFRGVEGMYLLDPYAKAGARSSEDAAVIRRNSRMKVWPNPSEDRFFIQLPFAERSFVDMVLYDDHGNVVQSGPMDVYDTMELPMTDMRDGRYYLIIQDIHASYEAHLVKGLLRNE